MCTASSGLASLRCGTDAVTAHLHIRKSSQAYPNLWNVKLMEWNGMEWEGTIAAGLRTHVNYKYR